MIKKVAHIALSSTILGIVLLLVSWPLSRTETLEIVGNVCGESKENPEGYCYEYLPQVGFPFVFLKDSNATSVIGSLGPEDDFFAGAFLADLAVSGIGSGRSDKGFA